MSLHFSKYHGIGNDFVVVCCDAECPADSRWLSPEHCIQICDRNFGVGADGVIMYAKTQELRCKYEMRIINADGSEAQMCGNGIRCLARHLADAGAGDALQILTGAGVISTAVRPSAVSVNMGRPRLAAADVPSLLPPDPCTGMALDRDIEVLGAVFAVSAVSMGNPHGVIFVDSLEQTFAKFPLSKIGPCISSHPSFPQCANIEFVEIISRRHAKMVVWERGSGRTLACGTGACAVVVAGVLTSRLDRSCTVSLEGGDLHLEWCEEGGTPSAHGRLDSDQLLGDMAGCVIKTGPAREVFKGKLNESIASLAGRKPSFLACTK